MSGGGGNVTDVAGGAAALGTSDISFNYIEIAAKVRRSEQRGVTSDGAGNTVASD